MFFHNFSNVFSPVLLTLYDTISDIVSHIKVCVDWVDLDWKGEWKGGFGLQQSHVVQLLKYLCTTTFKTMFVNRLYVFVKK